MNLQYKQFHPASSATWFAQFDARDQQQLVSLLTDFLLYLTEKSMRRTEDPWATAAETVRSIWGHSQYENRPNNLISVLGGIIKKLRSNLDLTQKQLAHAEKIGSLMPLLGDSRQQFPLITFQLVVPKTTDTNSLFDGL
jgi:hypothetical protein